MARFVGTIWVEIEVEDEEELDEVLDDIVNAEFTERVDKAILRMSWDPKDFTEEVE